MTPYLYAHPNPNAPERANGIRFWGHPQRRAPIRLIVIHTAENLPDYSPLDDGAEDVAAYLARVDRPASYHEVGDSDSHVTLLPPKAVAFGARGWNTPAWHWSFATRARLWPDTPDEWRLGALAIAATRCSVIARAYGIPARRVTLAQAEAGASGFAAHGDLDPDRRYDPGVGFPWPIFLGMIDEQVRRYGMVIYARRGTVDAQAALAAHAAVPSGVVTMSLDEAREALARREPVVAVGGPACDDLAGTDARMIRGATGAETMRLVAELAEQGWR